MRETFIPRSAISRRRLLAGSAGLAMPAIIGRAARAEDSQVVVGTWGGDYARLLHENIEVPLLQPQGITVVQDVGDEGPRTAKVIAQRRLPRGSVDVVCAQAPGCFRMSEMGLIETLDETKVPNLKFVQKELHQNYMAPHIFSLQIIIYDPSKITEPPKSFTDLLDPKYNGKIGFPSANYNYVMMGASLKETGSPDHLEEMKGTMEKLNNNGLRIYPETDNIAAAFKSGEIVIGMMWLARVTMWQNAGVNVKAAFPEEGCVVYQSSMVVPKNAPNKEGAFKYLNAALEPSAQQGFAAHMGYLPTVDDAPLSGKVAEQLKLPDPRPRMAVPDYAYQAKIMPAMNEWWAKLTAKT